MKIKYPVKAVKISQSFGFDNSKHEKRKSFYTLFDNRHPGVDFDLHTDTPIYASFSGIVVRNEFHRGMGNVVSVRNGNIVALYAHLNESNVQLGEIIEVDNIVGLSGNTGTATLMPHLHFELRDISKSILKNMVFDPPFGKELVNYFDTFVYKVNNINTTKTLESISKLFFGIESYSEKLRNVNNLRLENNALLQQGSELIIPNY